MSIHSRNEAVILEFGLHKPAYRICVNTPTTHGSIGLTTGLDPAMTLGCGGFGGNITSDNISPRHLLNIKRLAYELRPATWPATAGPERPLPVAAQGGAPAERLAQRWRRESTSICGRAGLLPARPGPPPPAAPASRRSAARPTPPVEKPVAFVCEDDVRQAIRSGTDADSCLSGRS